MVGIYKIVSPSGKVYIGQSVNIENRFKLYQNLKCKGQVRLYNSLVKYGVSTHIFLIKEECRESELNSRERYWQEYYDVLSENGLNCKLTTTGDKSGRLSETVKSKISNSNKGKESWIKGKQQSDTHKRNRSESTKGKPSNRVGYFHSSETKQKISEANKGRIPSKESRRKMSESKKGLPSKLRGISRSFEVREKISKAQLGKSKKPHTEETKEKISNKLTKIKGKIGGYNKEGILIFTFDSIKEVVSEGFTLTGVFRCVQGFTKSHKQVIWKQIND